MTQNTLHNLLEDSFEHYQVLWNENQFHNHTAHHLGSLILLGANDEQLKNIYENTMRRYVRKYEPSPHEITKENWRHSLGDPQFCLAYRDFFTKELPTRGDWQKKFFQILVDDAGGSPLIDGAFCGVLHPVIHMSYAIELNSRPVACEALTMTAVCSTPLHQNTTKLKPPTHGTKGAFQLIKEISSDEKVPKVETTSQFETVLNMHESFICRYYNQWKMSDNLEKTIEELFDMSVYMYASTHKPNQIDFDFFILHLVTGMDAVRKLRSHLDDVTVRRLLCSFFYLSIAIYIGQEQPEINEHLVDDYQVEENKFSWKYAVGQILNTKLATDPHLVKVIRALKDAEGEYGSKNGLYLRAAIKTVDNLHLESTWDYYKSVEPWAGAPNAMREMNVNH